MEKIQFSNNSEPYLSAENLNQMQDNIETAINEKNYIVATSTGTTTLRGNTDIPLIRVRSSGAKLTVKNNKIKIGANVSRVRISGGIFMDISVQSNGYLWGRIAKNGTHALGSIHPVVMNMGFVSASIPTTIIDVNENDLLYLNVDAAGIVGTIRNGDTTTWLCVEVIE